MCSHKMIFMDCFASLAMTDTAVLSFVTATNHRHCEERSDEAIHERRFLDCFAALTMTLFVTIIKTVPKGHNFHNRRSLTCGIGAHHNLCPKGRTYRLSMSCLSGSLPDVLCRRSMTCGYENYVPSGLFVVARTMALTSVFALFSFGTKRIFAMTDAFVFADAKVSQAIVHKPSSTNHRHCEERSDEAIHVITNRKPYIKIKNSNKKP